MYSFNKELSFKPLQHVHLYDTLKIYYKMTVNYFKYLCISYVISILLTVI